MALTTKELDEQDHEEQETVTIRTGCALTVAHRPNHQDPVDEGTQNGVRDLSNKLTNSEDVGGVYPRRRLANEDPPVGDPQRLDLCHKHNWEDTCPKPG